MLLSRSGLPLGNGGKSGSRMTIFRLKKLKTRKSFLYTAPAPAGQL